MYINQVRTLGQRVAISYLPLFPAFAVERADFETRWPFYVVLFALSAVFVFFYLLAVKALLTWRVSAEWNIKTIRKRTRDVMPRRANYRI